MCPTYNKVDRWPALLAEAVQSFLVQDYPDRELIVLNDNHTIEIVCDAPGVTVVNETERYPTLGDKYNAMVRLASGDLLAPWEDDDISLPWRLSLSVGRLARRGGAGRYAGYYNPRRYWYWNRGRYHHRHGAGVGHSCSLYTRHAFEAAGGYPPLSGPQDMEMDSRLKRAVGCVGSPEDGCGLLDVGLWFYVFRYGVTSCHLSAGTSDNSLYDAMAVGVANRSAAGDARRTHTVVPGWDHDYAAVTAALAREAVTEWS